MTSEAVNGDNPSAGFVEQPAIDESGDHSVTLPYTLGDLCLLRVEFKAQIVHAKFDPNAVPVALPLVPPAIPDDVAVAVYFGKLIPENTRTLYAHARALCYVRNRRLTHYIDLRGSFADYVKEFSHKRRNTLQRNVRKLAASFGGAMECKPYRGPDGVTEFHRLARQVAVKTYQEKLFDGAIPGSAEFVAGLQKRALDDSFRGFVLLVERRPVSYMYLVIDDGVAELRYLGYDPQFAESSPGTVLMYLALEHIFAEDGLRFLNLSFGEGQMKKVFGRGTFMQGGLYYFRWTARNVIAVYAHLATDKTSRWIGNLLSTLGIRKTMRRVIRSIWAGTR